jgi:mannosyltransferase OCH1-like enzyme
MTSDLLASAHKELRKTAFSDTPIPRIIHMTARDKNLQGDLADNLTRITELNPGWDLRLYDDADIEAFLLREFGPATRAIYHKLNPRYGAARADFFRYM